MNFNHVTLTISEAFREAGISPDFLPPVILKSRSNGEIKFVLSEKEDCYYTVTKDTCSCDQFISGMRPCPHQIRVFEIYKIYVKNRLREKQEKLLKKELERLSEHEHGKKEQAHLKKEEDEMGWRMVQERLKRENEDRIRRELERLKCDQEERLGRTKEGRRKRRFDQKEREHLKKEEYRLTTKPKPVSLLKGKDEGVSLNREKCVCLSGIPKLTSSSFLAIRLKKEQEEVRLKKEQEERLKREREEERLKRELEEERLKIEEPERYIQMKQEEEQLKKEKEEARQKIERLNREPIDYKYLKGSEDHNYYRDLYG